MNPPTQRSASSSCSSSSSSSLSSSSSPSPSPSPSPRAQVDALRERVQQDGSYQQHLALVNALRTQCSPHELRAARERFARAHALDAQLWLQWLHDELSLAESDQQRVALLPLFQRALRDFLHVPLHHLYLQTLIALWRRRAVREHVLCDALQQSVRLGAMHHFTEGESLWRLYQSIAPQLSQHTPLQQPCYHSHSSELATQCRAFEANVTEAQQHNDAHQLIYVYCSYAAFAHHAHPLLAISVYERMLTLNFAHPAAWLHYLTYLTTHSEKHRLVSVSDRAIRNVPKSIPVWSHALLAAQYHPNPPQKLSSLIQRAKPFVETSEDYAAAEAFSKHAWSVFLALGAPHHLLPPLNHCLSFNVSLSVQWASATCFAATILASTNHVQSAVQLFESVIHARPTETRWRLQFAHALAAKCEHSVRDMFQQAVLQLASATDANILRDAWQAFEVAVAPTDSLLHRLRHIDATSAKRSHPAPPVSRDEHAAHKRSKLRRDKPRTSKKQRLDAHDQLQQRDAHQSTRTNARAQNDAHNMEDVRTQPALQSLPQTVPHQAANHVQAVQNAQNGHAKRSDGDHAPELNTVFVSNLPFSVKEQHLRQFFSDAGDIRQVRLPLRSDGAPKGIAYVEFEHDSAVQSALNKHLQAVLGRTVSVKRSNPPQKKRGSNKARATTTRRRASQPRGSAPRKLVLSGIDTAKKDVDMKDNVDASANDKQESDHKHLNQDDFRAMLNG